MSPPAAGSARAFRTSLLSPRKPYGRFSPRTTNRWKQTDRFGQIEPPGERPLLVSLPHCAPSQIQPKPTVGAFLKTFAPKTGH
jgi:hypothetical protein